MPVRSSRCERSEEPPCGREAVEQKALAVQLDAAGLLWCHVPNGGARSRREATELRRQGVRAGVPDVLVFTPAGGYRGAAIELKVPARRPKTSRAGRWSGAWPEQRLWLNDLEAAGWYVAVAYGAKHAVELLRAGGWTV